MKAWQRIDDGQVAHKIGYRSVVAKQFKMNNGAILHADVTGQDGSQAAGVIALTAENKVVIARQFRCGPEKVMEEIPGGMVDPGENPEQAARREMREEVGYEAGSLEYLGQAYANAWDNTLHHYYLGRDCYKIDSSNPEPDEEIIVDAVDIGHFLENAKKGLMTDAAAVVMAYDKLVEIKGGV